MSSNLSYDNPTRSKKKHLLCLKKVVSLDTPKIEALIEKILNIALNPGDSVLNIFAEEYVFPPFGCLISIRYLLLPHMIKTAMSKPYD